MLLNNAKHKISYPFTGLTCKRAFPSLIGESLAHAQAYPAQCQVAFDAIPALRLNWPQTVSAETATSSFQSHIQVDSLPFSE